jgi:bifunctional UDP-N-acetylglucosamine pyrophosphorylase / glucosamine-1-phosphate N-acetyltransferase
VSVSRPAAVIVLAAGEGTRMKSSLPKVLHPLCGRTMLDHVLTAARELDPEQLIVVVGHGRDQVIRHLAEHAPDVRVVIQDRQGGTGHAVRTVIESVGLGGGTVIVTYGDTPVLRGQTLVALAGAHAGHRAAATALTTIMADPTGYGRIVRDDDGAFAEIVEESEATEQQRGITEINTGIYAFEGDLLADSVKRVATDNAKGEEYLTDVIAILRADGHHVASVVMADSDEVQGVNDRAQLAAARQVLNARLVRDWMRAGVTIEDPSATAIDTDVVLAPDVHVGPGTQLQGKTVVEAGARIGPGCCLRDTTVGRDAAVTHAVCESAVIGPEAVVGPFTHLPPGTKLGPGARVTGPAGSSGSLGTAGPVAPPGSGAEAGGTPDQ